MRAIIVEDEQLMIDAFMRLSKNIEDLTVVEKFMTAEEAVEYSETNSYEVAFLDIELPGMNGIDCAEKLRKKCQNSSLFLFLHTIVI